MQSSHVCATVADKPLWVVQGFKDVRLKVGFCLFFQVRPSLQLEQATHTALKAWKHWQMFRRTGKVIPIQMTCNFYVGESLRTPSLEVYLAFHIVTEFKKSNVTKAKPLESTKVTSFTKHFVYPQLWNWMIARLVDGFQVPYNCSQVFHGSMVKFSCLCQGWLTCRFKGWNPFLRFAFTAKNKEVENPVPSHKPHHSKDHMDLRPLSTRLETLQEKDSL